MSRTKKTLTPEIEQTISEMNEAKKHHIKFREYAREHYSYHHQMVEHLSEKIEKLQNHE